MLKSIIKAVVLTIIMIIVQYLWVFCITSLLFLFYNGNIDAYLKSSLFQTATLLSSTLFTITFIFILRKFTPKNNFVYTEKIFLLFMLGVLLGISIHLIRLLIGNINHENFSLLILITTGILGPLFEEYLYRGKVYSILKERLENKPAMIITTILFALSHNGIGNVLYAFLIGSILIIIYNKTNSIKASSAFHIGANVMALLFVNFCI